MDSVLPALLVFGALFAICIFGLTVSAASSGRRPSSIPQRDAPSALLRDAPPAPHRDATAVRRDMGDTTDPQRL